MLQLFNFSIECLEKVECALIYKYGYSTRVHDVTNDKDYANAVAKILDLLLIPDILQKCILFVPV